VPLLVSRRNLPGGDALVFWRRQEEGPGEFHQRLPLGCRWPHAVELNLYCLQRFLVVLNNFLLIPQSIVKRVGCIVQHKVAGLRCAGRSETEGGRAWRLPSPASLGMSFAACCPNYFPFNPYRLQWFLIVLHEPLLVNKLVHKRRGLPLFQAPLFVSRSNLSSRDALVARGWEDEGPRASSFHQRLPLGCCLPLAPCSTPIVSPDCPVSCTKSYSSHFPLLSGWGVFNLIHFPGRDALLAQRRKEERSRGSHQRLILRCRLPHVVVLDLY
jgi:hypothetical protein